MKKYLLKSQIKISKHGWCWTFNIVESSDMLYADQAADYFGGLQSNKPVVMDKSYRDFVGRAPIFVTNKANGFHGAIATLPNQYLTVGCRNALSERIEACNNRNEYVLLSIHSPFEMLDGRHRTFMLNRKKSYEFAIIPQVRATDGSLMGLDADEYEIWIYSEKKIKFNPGKIKLNPRKIKSNPRKIKSNSRKIKTNP